MIGKSVLISGGHGFLGWHIACAFHAEGWAVTRLAREDDWASKAMGAKILVHCAGTNRGSEAEIRDGNSEAATRAAELVQSGQIAHVIYLNSTQSGNGSVYGEAKELAGKLLETACEHQAVTFTEVLVPNVFGEHGLPNYNSFVATFCATVASGAKPSIENDKELALAHASDVADHVVQVAACKGDVESGIITSNSTVSNIANLLGTQHASYVAGVLPDLTDRFERLLFNTLRSFMYPASYPFILDPKRDNRGHLVETIKAGSGGQSFVSWTHPEITRGNHYHRRKFERFLVLEGEAEIKLRRLFHDEVVTFRVGGNTPGPVDMPVLHTHNITNVGKGELVTMFWTNEIFDPEHPDTYAEMVEFST
jgi:UDP-2-acetamido-2,6-beta-L-arabino-hexul-4-ose reductase